MAELPPVKSVYYFCDESHLHDDFMGVGGLAVPDRHMKEIAQKLNEIKVSCGVTREIKWKSARNRRNCPHTAYANYMKELIDENKVNFHIRIAPFKKYDHTRTGRKDLADTTGKAHFSLLYHRALRYYGKNYKIHIRPDNGDCTSKLIGLQDSLEAQAWAKYGTKRSCIASYQCRDSEKEPMLQLLDVTLGGITAYRNSKHLLPSTSEAKRNLCKHIFTIHKINNIEGNSPPSERGFSLWNVKPNTW